MLVSIVITNGYGNNEEYIVFTWTSTRDMYRCDVSIYVLATRPELNLGNLIFHLDKLREKKGARTKRRIKIQLKAKIIRFGRWDGGRGRCLWWPLIRLDLDGLNLSPLLFRPWRCCSTYRRFSSLFSPLSLRLRLVLVQSKATEKLISSLFFAFIPGSWR